MRNRGFTLIELLIVISIVAVLAAAGAASFFGIRNRKVLEAQADVTVADLISTRERSKAQEGGDGWGVRFENPTGDNNDYYEVWTGDSYASGVVMSRVSLSPGVVFTDPVSASSTDVVFLKSTGIPMNGVGYTIVVQSVSSGDTITITVSPIGVVSVVTLSAGAYDVGTSAFVQIALSVGVQESGPRDMLFNNDGTKLYITGDNGDEINEYSLASAYDISTAVFTQIVLDVSAQEAGPASMLFNNDGTKLYLIGWDNENVYEYSLATAYDISTATYTQIALDVQLQEATPLDMIFNNDGTKLYVVGWSGVVNEYSLASAYDISTATFTQIALSVGAQEADPSSILFNNDGTKFYVMGRVGDDINEYSLTTPYDVGTATFTQIALDVSAQDIYPVDMIFNNNGTKLYVIGRTGDNIYEYAIGG